MEDKILHFIACGLVFDAAGVCFLGFAFFFKSKEAIIQEAGTYYNSNPHVLRSITASRLDGIFGTCLLFIGFLYQMLGFIGLENHDVTSASYFILISTILIYFVNFRKRHVNKWCNELEEIINKPKP